MSTIGQRIKTLRIEANITQKQFGDIFGIVKSTVSMYENDNSTPDTEMLKKIAKFFNVSIDYLLGITDIREPVDELIKKGTVKVEEPSKIEQISKDLPEQERKELESYADYLHTKSKLSDSGKESSATSETIEDIKEKAN